MPCLKYEVYVTLLPHPSPLLLSDRRSPQPSAAAKIKDCGYNFHQDNAKQSPAKITRVLRGNPTLQSIYNSSWLPQRSMRNNYK